MAAPSNTVWGSISDDRGKLGIAISASNTNTTTTLTVQVWLALKYNIDDDKNTYSFSYTNDSGSTSTSSDSNLVLNFGTSSGAGWAEVSQKQIKTHTLTYTRGTAGRRVNLSAALNSLAGSNYNVSVSTTYDIPALPSYTVYYNGNGGSGAMPASTVYYGTAFKTRQNTITRTGYTFAGWNEKADGTGTKWGITSSDDGTYESGNSWTWTYTKNITLYAQWTEHTMTVNYCGNGADYGTYQGQSVNLNDVVHTDVFLYDNSYTTGLSNVQNKDYLYLSRTGYSPTHYWLTAGDNYISVHEDDTSLNSGEAVANAFGLTLANSNQAVRVYAAWKKNTYTFNFVANGGSGNMDAQLVNWEDSFQLSKNLFKREGYTFIGWNVCRDDGKWYVNYNGWLTEDEIAAGGYEKKMYDNQVELTLNESWISDNEDARTFTMYALWEISGVVYIDNGTSFEPYLTYIDNGTGWDLYLAYVDNGTNWNIIS